MLFRKYQIIVVNPRQDKQHSFSMRAVWLVLPLALFFVLAMGNYGFFQYYSATCGLPQDLAQAHERLQVQESQVLALTRKAQSLQDDFGRVQDFNASLRTMLCAKSSDALGSFGLPSGHEDDCAHVKEDAPVKSGTKAPCPSHLPPVPPDAADLGLGTLPLHRQELLTRKIHTFFDSLRETVLQEEVYQQELIHLLRERQGLYAAVPSIWPTTGIVTSKFGWRHSPTRGASTFHKGLDIAKNDGAPIVAPANGTVTFAGRQRGYGNCVEIRHANGITTRYAHMKNFTVERGQKVERRDVIGYVGNSGRTTGPHLHYEVRKDGVPQNPMNYIPH